MAHLRQALKFSLSVAFASSVGILVGNTDKFLLSKILTLADYGYFTLATLVASGVLVVSGPIAAAILPKMVKLEAQGDSVGLIQIYRQATQVVAVIASAVSLTMAYFAEPLMWIWTGDAILANQVAPVLTSYALGNGVLTLGAFPYYLQYAKGNLRLHLIGNLVFVFLLIPAIAVATIKFGGLGAGYVWLGMNIIFFIVWLPIIHRKFAPGLNCKWYLQDILTIVIPVIITGYGLSRYLPIGDSRWMILIQLVLIGLFTMLVGSGASSVMRGRLIIWTTRRMKWSRV